MRRLLLITIAWMFAAISFAQEQREYLIQMNYSSRSEIQKITQLVSIDDVEGNQIVAYASPKQLLQLDKYGYQYTIIPKPAVDTKSIQMATTVAEMANWDKYPTYEVYVEMMEQFAADYPSICKLDTIGYSVEGRQLLAVKISDNVNLNEIEPEVFYTATMHGDETTGFVVHLRLIDYLLSNYGSDEEVNSIVDNVALWINPAANPDGTYNGGNSTVASATRYNGNSVDINRNFPDPRAGDHPDGNSWQPETVAMMEFAELHSFVLSENTHGGTEVVNYPWDTWTERHPDDAWWQRVSHAYADTAQEVSPSNYMNEYNDGITNGSDWYIITGGRQDYMNYFQHCKEFTLEISDVKLLASEELQNHWVYNYQSLLNHIKETSFGIRGLVTNSNGDPVAAEIRILGHDDRNSWVVTDPENGDYYRMIEAGTWDVEYTAYGYVPQTFENITITDGEAVEIDVVLQEAQTVAVTGVVTNQISGDPIEGATIELLGAPIDPVVTDANGEFSIDGVLEDNYSVRVYKEGFAGITDEISVTTENNYFAFALSPVNAISFEGGVLPGDFTTSGNADWFVTDANAFDGVFSAQSGDISDNQSTEMSFTYEFNQASEISFAYCVSSESGYDYLKFYIDGAQQDQWAGTIAWAEVSYAVSEGEHTFTWEYMKDGSQSNGEDAAWVDFIVLPMNDPLPGTAELSVNTVDFYIGASGEMLSTDITITNVGDSALTYTTAMQNGDWCSITTNPVELAADESAIITLVADASGLTDGEYNDVLIVEADQTFNIPVTLTISDFGTVTFTVQDENSSVIEGAEIIIDGNTLTTNSEGVAEITLNNGTYNYEVEAYGFDPATGSITIEGGNIEEVVTLPEINYTVTFTVKNSAGAFIQNASIGINGEELATNEQGQASIELGNGTYTYEVAADGYNTANGSISVDGSNVNKNVTLTDALYMLTFTVSSEEGVLEGAQIVIDGETLITNSEGVAQVELSNGVYNYHVSLNGYGDVDGEVEINNADAEVNVTLTGIGLILENAIKLYPNPAQESFAVSCPGSFEISVYNQVGRIITTMNCTDNTIVHVSEYSPGLYFINIKMNGNYFTSKIVVE